MGNRTDPSHRPAGAGGAAATEGERPGGAVTAGSVRDAVRLARALIADAPRRVALALLLMLAAGMTEAFGILMIVPLLQVVGLGGPAGGGGAVARALGAAGVEMTLPAVLGLFLVLAAGRSAAAWQRDLLTARTRLEFVDRFTDRIYRATAGARWEFLLGRRQSDLLHVLTAEVNRIGQATLCLLQLTVTSVQAAAQMALAAAISPAATAAAIVTGAALLGSAHPLLRQSRTLGERLTGANRPLFASVTDFLAGLKLARVYEAEEEHVRRFTDAKAAVRRRRLAFTRTNAAARAAFQSGAAAALAALIWFAVSVADATPSELAIMALIFARVLPAAERLQRQTQELAHALPAYAHALAMQQALIEAAEAPAGTGGGARTAEDETASAADDGEATAATPDRGDARMALRRALTVRGVSFAHAPGGRPALAHVDLDVPAGALTVITGPSGAGKSTLAEILIGLVEPGAGRVLVDGVPLTGSNRRRWRRSVAVVPQDPYLFPDTLRANLRWARPDASDADLWRALGLAAADFVAALPDGLETFAGHRGTRFSGGERQRIALARALLREPALLVLDEATSHLDAENERRIVAGLRAGATVVAIAHGGELPAAADRCVRLDASRVVSIERRRGAARGHAAARYAVAGTGPHPAPGDRMRAGVRLR